MIYDVLEEYKDVSRYYPKTINWLRDRSVKYGL
jgi:hypothetical protein